MAVFVDFHIIIMLGFIVLVGCVSSSFGTNEEKVSIDVAASGQHGRNEIFDEPNKYYANENKNIWTNRHQARSPTVLMNVEKHDDKDNFGHGQHADSYAEQLAIYFGKHIRKRRAMVKRQLMDDDDDDADLEEDYETQEECPQGTFGANCIEICNCQNGAQCDHVTGVCICEGYTGAQCETPLCEQNCNNGGTCRAPNTCSCLDSYTGDTCDERECTNTYCNIPDRGHRCSFDFFGNLRCTCLSGFIGAQCDVTISGQ